MKKISYFSFVFLIFSCNNANTKVKTIKEYFPTGEIKTEYKTLNNKIIDTIYQYYKDGKIDTKIPHDSSGAMTGLSESYYDNGILESSINYVKGIAEGDRMNYDSLGNLLSKTYFFNDKKVGDKYIFENNKVVGYMFFDFDEELATEIDYDNNGKITNNDRQTIFFDSIKVVKLPNKSNLYKIFILQSNPPHTSNKLVANYYDRQGKLIDHDSIPTRGTPFIELQKKVDSNYLTRIVFTYTQYDSVLKREYNWNEKYNLKHDK